MRTAAFGFKRYFLFGFFPLPVEYRNNHNHIIIIMRRMSTIIIVYNIITYYYYNNVTRRIDFPKRQKINNSCNIRLLPNIFANGSIEKKYIP